MAIFDGFWSWMKTASKERTKRVQARAESDATVGDVAVATLGVVSDAVGVVGGTASGVIDAIAANPELLAGALGAAGIPIPAGMFQADGTVTPGYDTSAILAQLADSMEPKSDNTVLYVGGAAFAIAALAILAGAGRGR